MNIFTLLFLIPWSMAVSIKTDLKQVMEEVRLGKAVIIDVREKTETLSGMIEKAIWFPKSKVETEKNWEKEFRHLTGDKKIFLYCRSGRRSGDFQKILKNLGIEAHNLGGYEDVKSLKSEGRP